MGNIPGWRGELTGSASGSGAGDIGITMNLRTFFPNMGFMSGSGRINWGTQVEDAAPTDQTGYVRLFGNITYAIDWRYIQV